MAIFKNKFLLVFIVLASFFCLLNKVNASSSNIVVFSENEFNLITNQKRELLPLDIKNNDSNVSCEGILGDPDNDQKPAYWIQYVLDIMKYIAIAALIVLSAMDFFKAIVSNDKDSLQKAGKTTGLRFIYCVILFFLPVLVNFVMSLLGLYDTCGIG